MVVEGRTSKEKTEIIEKKKTKEIENRKEREQ
jgi:hypothetical protein